MIYFDTETCGFHGMAALIQWAEDEGEVQLFSPWTRPIHETLSLIEKFCSNPGGIIGFNLAFDFFHLTKLYTVFSLWHDHDEIPENIIDELAGLERQACDGPCIKPVTACDIMLHARKGPYQSTMERGDIRIRRVPTAIAYLLAAELDRRIVLKDVYFARKKNKKKRWEVRDILDDDEEINPDFKDIVLKFAPSSALKALAVDALGVKQDDILLFTDVEVDEAFYPKEYGYAPYACVIGNRHNWNGAWPEKIQHHIDHWTYNDLARKYAKDDVIYTRELYKYFGSPEPGDDDSILACMVASVRWRGYKIDCNKLRIQRDAALKLITDIPTAAAKVKYWIGQKLDPTEQLVLRGGTKKVLLEEIAKFKQPCPHCNGEGEVELVEVKIDDDLVEAFDAPEMMFNTVVTGNTKTDCVHCQGKGAIDHPACERARLVLAARKAKKEIELYDKLLLAGRFHASFKVIGALSGRMSGADKLNAQGVNSQKEIRECFTLALDGTVLGGGDFDGFEVTIADATYNDPDLRRDLLTCELCEGEAIYVKDEIPAIKFLAGDGLDKYITHRLKAETKKQSKKSTYVCKSVEEIKSESFHNQFICQECGSDELKKIHGLFGVHVFTEFTYDEIVKSKGTINDMYTNAKRAVFAMFYGGEGPTLADRLGVDIDTANAAFLKFTRRYKNVGRAQARINDLFCSMRQPNGIGTAVEWHEPAEYVESMFGFRRYFTLENMICKTLFEMANKPPKSWKGINVKVQRRDRVQTAMGAAQSALYAAAFNIQASDMRAAKNHEIQSSGSTMTKYVERKIWDIQPSGIHPWLVQPMNIHDEIMNPCVPEVADQVKEVVDNAVEHFRPKVPLIRMKWHKDLKSWADK